jgi:predicted CXXCH cytochrome family protein
MILSGQTVGKFLVKPNEASALCLTCHQKAGWLNSSHRLPADPLTDQRYTDQQGAHTGYVGVSQNGCESCHRPHAPQVDDRLVKFSEENACYACHDGSVVNASLDIRGEFEGKTYTHPVALTPSVHDAAESPSAALFPLPETSGGAPRHTECVDCHNPHYASALVTQPPAVGGALLGTPGHSTAGTFLPQSANEFETCFKCHADSANRPQFLDDTTVGVGYGRNPQRQFDAGNPNRFNTRLEFEFGASYHPVTRPRNLSAGIGGEVPSLRTAPITPGGSPLPNRTLNAASYIYCSDCHNNDSGRNLGSIAGPSGVHGSSFEHLLERQNLLEVPPAVPGDRGAGASYALSNYALCDKCHDIENSILRDDSFDDHRKHIRGGSSAACSTCHDPHSSTAPMLINFDLSVVGPSSSGRLEFQRTAPRQGACYLTCHGKDHDPADYGS